MGLSTCVPPKRRSCDPPTENEKTGRCDGANPRWGKVGPAGDAEPKELHHIGQGGYHGYGFYTSRQGLQGHDDPADK